MAGTKFQKGEVQVVNTTSQGARQQGSEAKGDHIDWTPDMMYISCPMKRRTQFLMTSNVQRGRWAGEHLNRSEESFSELSTAFHQKRLLT